MLGRSLRNPVIAIHLNWLELTMVLSGSKLMTGNIFLHLSSRRLITSPSTTILSFQQIEWSNAKYIWKMTQLWAGCWRRMPHSWFLINFPISSHRLGSVLKEKHTASKKFVNFAGRELKTWLLHYQNPNVQEYDQDTVLKRRLLLKPQIS